MFRLGTAPALPATATPLREDRDRFGAVDGEWGLAVRRVWVWRETDYTGWILCRGDAVVPFGLSEYLDFESGTKIERLAIHAFGSEERAGRETGTGNFTFSSEEQKRAWLMLAVEGVLVHYRPRSPQDWRDPRVWALGRVWTAADFGYSTSDLEAAGGEDKYPEPLVDQRPVVLAVAAALARASDSSSPSRPSAVSFDDFRGLGTPPAIGGTSNADSAVLQLNDSFLVGGGLALVNDVVVSPSDAAMTTLFALTRERSATVTGPMGAPLSQAVSADGRALWEEAAKLMATSSMWRKMGRSLIDIPVDQANTLLEFLIAGDARSASAHVAGLVRRNAAGRDAATASLGFAAAMLGRAPVGWIPFGVLIGGLSVGSAYGEVLVSRNSPHLTSLLNHWFKGLQSRAPIHTSPDPQDLAMRKCIEGLLR